MFFFFFFFLGGGGGGGEHQALKQDLAVIGLFLVWMYEDMNILDGG